MTVSRSVPVVRLTSKKKSIRISRSHAKVRQYIYPRLLSESKKDEPALHLHEILTSPPPSHDAHAVTQTLFFLLSLPNWHPQWELFLSWSLYE